MDSAKILFDKLTLDYINAEMLGKQFENNILECKQKDRPENGNIEMGDKAKFAKCLSGFANTGGGVVVFGLDARKQDGIDEITAITPISELKKFESGLREIESRVVERNIQGVEYKRLETEPEKGLLAVYIPQSLTPPHRSLVDHHFYIRAGGTFQPLDLPLIEDLFHRRQQPKLSLIAKLADSLHIYVYLKNDGEVTAKDPYVVLKLPEGLSLTGYELDGNTRQFSCIALNSFNELSGHLLAFKNGSATPIHPKSEVPLFSLRIVNGQSAGRTFKFNHYIYANDMKPVEGEFVLST